MESYKQEYPDSFYAKLYDWELMTYYRQQHDTLAFLEEAQKFLAVPDICLMDFYKAKITVFRGATAFAKAEAECQTVALACVIA